MRESELTMAAAGHGAAMEESPYGMQSKKLAMWLFIASDAVTFTVALVAYGFLLIGSPDWTRPFHFWPSIANGLIMTFVLLTSSLTMLAAVRAANSGDKHKSVQWIGFTILLGIIFAGLHLREWFHMFADGWGLFKNPTGGSADFGAAFFSVTGLHLLHVISGVVALAVIAWGYNRGRLYANPIRTTSLS